MEHVSPSQIASDELRQQAVDEAWNEAVRRHHALALLGTSNSLKSLMARVVDDAVKNGVADIDALKEAAIQVVPQLRRPDGRRRVRPIGIDP